jgi:hypothetical protein
MVGGCKGMFKKELEKKLFQLKVDEFFLKYKLEAYQKHFLDLIYGSLISTKVSG